MWLYLPHHTYQHHIHCEHFVFSCETCPHCYQSSHSRCRMPSSNLTLTLASQIQFYTDSYTSDFFNSERFSPFLWFSSKYACLFSNIDSSYSSEFVLARLASSKGSKLLPPCSGSKMCVNVMTISGCNCLFCLFIILIWFYLQIYFCFILSATRLFK